MTNDPQALLIMLEVVFITMVTFLAWFSKRSVTRIDRIEEREKEYISRKEYRADMQQLRHDVNDGHKQITSQLRDIYKVIIENNNKKND